MLPTGDTCVLYQEKGHGKSLPALKFTAAGAVICHLSPSAMSSKNWFDLVQVSTTVIVDHSVARVQG